MRWLVSLLGGRPPSEGLEAPQAPLITIKERMDLGELEVVVDSCEDSSSVEMQGESPACRGQWNVAVVAGGLGQRGGSIQE